MDLNTLTSGLANPATLIPSILKEWRPCYEQSAFKNYEPEGHKINDKWERKDKIKTIPVPGGGPDDVQVVTEKVARIALALQKLIVKRAAAFATGGDTAITASTEDEKSERLLQLIKDTWSNNKLRYKNGPLFKAVLSQLEAAEVWYSETVRDNEGRVTKAKMRCRFYFPADGWDLIPVFDNMGDLIAFGLGYKDRQTDKKFLDLYTSDSLRKYTMESGYGWAEREPPIALKYGKIPVVYYSVPKADWEDVQVLIDRLERLMSGFADTNDYNGSPILGLYGEAISIPNKGEAGKAIQFQEGADAKYITWEGKPEAIISEHDMLLRFIYSITQTPDLSFEAMKGLGDISGVAFKRMLIDAHLKAKDAQEGWYGEGIQRRLNFLVAACREITPELSGVDIDVNPTFAMYSIEDDREMIETLQLANGGKPLISHRESVKLANLTEDGEATYDELINQELVTKEPARSVPLPVAK